MHASRYLQRSGPMGAQSDAVLFLCSLGAAGHPSTPTMLRAGANFENAQVMDVLFDRAVIVDANLRNANFERTVWSR